MSFQCGSFQSNCFLYGLLYVDSLLLLDHLECHCFLLVCFLGFAILLLMANSLPFLPEFLHFPD